MAESKITGHIELQTKERWLAREAARRTWREFKEVLTNCLEKGPDPREEQALTATLKAMEMAGAAQPERSVLGGRPAPALDAEAQKRDLAAVGVSVALKNQPPPGVARVVEEMPAVLKVAGRESHAALQAAALKAREALESYLEEPEALAAWKALRPWADRAAEWRAWRKAAEAEVQALRSVWKRWRAGEDQPSLDAAWAACVRGRWSGCGSGGVRGGEGGECAARSGRGDAGMGGRALGEVPSGAGRGAKGGAGDEAGGSVGRGAGRPVRRRSVLGPPGRRGGWTERVERSAGAGACGGGGIGRQGIGGRAGPVADSFRGPVPSWLAVLACPAADQRGVATGQTDGQGIRLPGLTQIGIWPRCAAGRMERCRHYGRAWWRSGPRRGSAASGPAFREDRNEFVGPT